MILSYKWCIIQINVFTTFFNIKHAYLYEVLVPRRKLILKIKFEISSMYMELANLSSSGKQFFHDANPWIHLYIRMIVGT